LQCSGPGESEIQRLGQGPTPAAHPARDAQVARLHVGQIERRPTVCPHVVSATARGSVCPPNGALPRSAA